MEIPTYPPDNEPTLDLWIVKIQDKAIMGEPDVGVAFVWAVDENSAIRAANADIIVSALASRGRKLCVPSARKVELNQFYRVRALVRPADVEMSTRDTFP